MPKPFDHDLFINNILLRGGIRAAIAASEMSQRRIYHERKENPEFDLRVINAVEYLRNVRAMRAHDNYQHLRSNILSIITESPMTPVELAKKTNTTLEQAAVTLLDCRAAGKVILINGRYHIRKPNTCLATYKNAR